MSYEIAQQRIDAARRQGSVRLNLSGLGLQELPLALNGNQLTELPAAIGGLQELRELSLGKYIWLHVELHGSGAGNSVCLQQTGVT